MVHAGGSSRETQDAYLAYLKVRAAEWVERLWPQIEIVANALIERRTLTGEEVEELMRTVRPIPPAPVIDASSEAPDA